MAAAGELLDEGGLAAVTLREVGHRAGAGHNAPHEPFDDEEALLAAGREPATRLRTGDPSPRRGIRCRA